MKSTNSAEPDIIEMSRMYRFERDQRIILEKQIAALTFESITVPFSERFEQFIEALPSCQMRSNLRWIQSNFCKTHQEVISMSNGACPYCEAAAPTQPVSPDDEEYPMGYGFTTEETIKQTLPEVRLSADEVSSVEKSVEILQRCADFGKRVHIEEPAAPSPVLTPLGICDNNSLLHPRADKHEQMETCENWRPCAPVRHVAQSINEL
jgi:hypothetical protein